MMAVRLGVGRVDDGVDVDAVFPGEPGELVCQPDVDVAIGRLGELGQLGRLGGAQVPDAVGPGEVGPLVEVEDRRVERRRPRRADPSRSRPPTSLGYLRRSANTRPVSTRSGENTSQKSLPSTRPEPRLEAGFQRVRGGADRQGRLVDHHRARA